MDHFGTGVLVLSVAGERDRDHFATGLAAFHDHAGIFHGEAGADVAIDPLDLGFLVGEAAFCHEVENIRRPVLDGDVLDFGALEGDEFHDGAVERGGLELRRGAAFHIHDLAAFIGDDEGALELAEVFGVDAEVGLKRVFHLHAWRDVDERAAGEDGAVERGELVVTGRNDFSEPLLENLGVLLQALGRADKDHALFADGGFDVRVGRFAVELGLDTGEEFPLLLGDAESLEGALHILGHIVPRALRLGALREVVADIVENDVLQIVARPVGGHGHGVELAEGVLAELTDPVRVFLHIRNVVDGFFREAGAGIEFVVHIVVEVADRAVDVEIRFGFHGFFLRRSGNQAVARISFSTQS